MHTLYTRLLYINKCAYVCVCGEMYLLASEEEQAVLLCQNCIRALATIADNILICKSKLISKDSFEKYSIMNYNKTEIKTQSTKVKKKEKKLIHRGNLLTYRRRIPSKFLGANLPFTTNRCCPSSDPLVPSSASKKVITCSGCLCILIYKNRQKSAITNNILNRKQLIILKTINNHIIHSIDHTRKSIT